MSNNLPPPLPTLPGTTNNDQLRRAQFEASNPVLPNPHLQGFAFSRGNDKPQDGKPPSSGGKRRKRTKCTYRKRRNLKRTRRGRKH